MYIEIILLSILIFIFLICIYFLIRIGKPNQITGLMENFKEPLVSIILPTRNEERNIKKCLESLVSLNYSNYEIIVVDGNSEDETIEIIKKFPKVKLLNEEPRPKGWIGKSWACYQGYKESKGEILLFTDADTIHAKDSLSETVQMLNNSAGFISLVTTQIFKTFWEFMLVHIYLNIGIAFNGVKGSKKLAVANGQYLMFTRDFYEKLGTHKAVSSSIIEDMEFALVSKRIGVRPKIIASQNLVKVRMYHGLDDLLEGYSKNLATGMKELKLVNFLKITIFNIYMNLWLIYSIILIVLTLNQNPLNLSVTISLIISNYFTNVIIFTVTEYYLSSKFSWHNLLYPIYIVMFYFLISSSLMKTRIKKEVIWKGITYHIN